jgi:ABC-type phosphate transport system substrate-binding protein
MKKWLIPLLIIGFVVGGILGTGCSKSDNTWTVFNRESGSGTRGTFEHKVMYVPGQPTTQISIKSQQRTSIAEVLEAVSSEDYNGIGYVSLGYLPYDGVKAITIDGIACTEETVFEETYPITRTLYFTTKGEADEAEKAFIYWCQNDGQLYNELYLNLTQAMDDYGYESKGTIISPKEGAAPDDPTGGWSTNDKVTEGGSTTVMPLAEDWSAEYEKVTGKIVETKGGGSGAGALGCYNDLFDIGAMSRELTIEEEEDFGLIPHDIALDGVAIVVGSHVYDEMGITNLTLEQLRDIFAGGSGTPLPISETSADQAGMECSAVCLEQRQPMPKAG